LDGARELVHGTAVAIGGRAALIRGPSGAGKSDLALRCLGLTPGTLLPRPAVLVADDRVLLSREGGRIRASAPESIRGCLEVRGLGIVTVESAPDADLVLVVNLVAPGAYERLPDPRPQTSILGLDLPLIGIAPREASAPLKLLIALEIAGHNTLRP
jgi:serine kinase of HPr protein (carbohydrate metabolism regulator)